jgi:hypothetical protein
LLATVLVPLIASAQGTQGTAAPATTANATPAPGGGGGGTGAAPGPGGSGSAAPAPTRDAAGYAYDDKKPAAARTGARRAMLRKPSGPTVNLPGFEQLPDGGSRLFVQLTQNVQVEERKAQGSITYILKGAHVRVHNNTNALVTVHFNTPVSRARLVPQGNDLHFIVELRAAATPTWKMTDAQDKTSMLTIDFAKGDFGGGDDAKQPPAAATKPVKGAKKGQQPAGNPEPAPAPGPNP